MRRPLSKTPAARIETTAPQRRSTTEAGVLRHGPSVPYASGSATVSPDPRAQGRALAGASGGRLARAGGVLLQFQRDYGNRHVQQVLRHADQASAGATGLALDPMEDRHERAAERVAEQVASDAPARPEADGRAIGRAAPVPAVQRAAGTEGGGRAGAGDSRMRQAIEAARGGGQPLPEQVRDAVEPVVGTGLSHVRLHTDARADQLTRALRARAFTTGSEIFLRRGEYRPGSTAGRRLLAHELAHVAQQTGGAAGASVIQRMKIGHLDTDVDKDLAELIQGTSSMDESEVKRAFATIERQLSGQDADVNVRKLLRHLRNRQRELSSQQEQLRAATEPEQETKAVPSDAAVELMMDKHGSLALRSAELIKSGRALAAGESATDTWVTSTGTWLSDAKAFESDWDKWDEDYTKLPTTKAKSQNLKTHVRPHRNQVDELTAMRRRLNRSHITREAEVQDQLLIAQRPARVKQGTAKRQQEAAAHNSLVRQYTGKLSFSLPDENQKKWKWGESAATVPEVLLEWAVTAMLAKVDQDKDSSSDWVGTSLGGLKRRTANSPDLHLRVIGHTRSYPRAHGMAVKHTIMLYLSLSGMDLDDLLTGDRPGDQRSREDIVARMASTFIHEYAHERQIEVYDNASLPWAPHDRYGGPDSLHSGTGLPPGKWTPDVQRAYAEFAQGGQSGAALGDKKWQDFSSALEGYLEPHKDMRANELVSHLMELAYAWRDDKKFRAVFPECAALLDRVIMKEEDAPGK